MPFDSGGGGFSGTTETLTITDNEGFATENQLDNAGNQCMTSPDGINWTQRSTPQPQSGFAASVWNNVIYAPALDLFCAVADNAATPLGPIMTSPDGATWTRRFEPAGNDFRIKAIAWSPLLGRFAAVGTGTVRTFKSSDGITWTVDLTIAGLTWESVTWSEPLGLFCAVATDGLAGNGVSTSPDGATWTVRAQAAVAIWRYIVWSDADAQFLAVASNNALNQVQTSPDGINWTLRVATGTTRQWQCVAFAPGLGIGNGRYCALADQGAGGNARAMTSDNAGITWAEHNILANNDNWHGIAWSPTLNLFAATAISGTGAQRIATSPDGIVWTARTAPGLNQWHGLTFANGIFVSVAGNQLTGVSTGTLANAPQAGPPTFWVPIVVNGIRRHFPTW